MFNSFSYHNYGIQRSAETWRGAHSDSSCRCEEQQLPQLRSARSATAERSTRNCGALDYDPQLPASLEHAPMFGGLGPPVCTRVRPTGIIIPIRILDIDGECFHPLDLAFISSTKEEHAKVFALCSTGQFISISPSFRFVSPVYPRHVFHCSNRSSRTMFSVPSPEMMDLPKVSHAIGRESVEPRPSFREYVGGTNRQTLSLGHLLESTLPFCEGRRPFWTECSLFSCRQESPHGLCCSAMRMKEKGHHRVAHQKCRQERISHRC